MRFLRYLLLLLLVIIFGLVAVNYPKLDLISGFSAKNVASAHFLDGRALEDIERGDNDIPLVRLASNKIDEAGRFATSSVFGLKTRKAVYRDGLGAVLIDGTFDETKPFETPHRNLSSDMVTPYPYGDAEPADTVFSNIDYAKLHRAVDAAFDSDGQKQKRTRSLLVIYKDRIIAEKYDKGFTKKSRILGWSMTKSVTVTMFGILQSEGKLRVDMPAPVSQWRNDARKNITISDLLHMNSGLEWEEQYDKISDATKMLFQAHDMSASQRDKPLTGKPGASWNYSSGTTNLLSGILRKQFATHQQYLDFWYSALIDRIGMHSMLIETDMAGNYVGSSYGWATTRDWAKLGLLYLHKGMWRDDKVFDPGWVRYVTTPTNGSGGRYGAHFWLNAGGYYPDAPRDMFSCNGFQGQMVFIIPSMDLVIVRMGLKEDPGFDFNAMLRDVSGAIAKTHPSTQRPRPDGSGKPFAKKP